MAMGLFQDHTVVVTGASSGIGRAIVLEFARYGADICLVARRREVLELVAQEVRANGGRGYVCCADLTCDESIHGLAETVRRNFNRLDILILSGGAIFHGTTDQATLDEFDLQYRSNLRGHYAVVKALLPSLRNRRGQIVFINSSVATRPSGNGVGQFAAIQHGLRAIADSLRDEVNPDGIRVLSVYPGRTATPRMASLFKKEGRPYHPELLMQPEDIAKMVACSLSLPRTAEVTDIAMRPALKSY